MDGLLGARAFLVRRPWSGAFMCSAYSRSTTRLLAQIKSAGWLPHYAIVLEALSPLGFTNLRLTGSSSLRDCSSAYCYAITKPRLMLGCCVDFLPRHKGPSDPGCLVGKRPRRDLRWLTLEQARHPLLSSIFFTRHSHDCGRPATRRLRK